MNSGSGGHGPEYDRAQREYLDRMAELEATATGAHEAAELEPEENS